MPAVEITRSTQPGRALAVGGVILLGERLGVGAASAVRLGLGPGPAPQFANSDNGLHALSAATSATATGTAATNASGRRAAGRRETMPPSLGCRAVRARAVPPARAHR